MSNKRERIIDHVKGMENLYSTEEYVYHISHMYSVEPSKTYVKTKLRSEVVDLFIAYLQYKSSEHYMEYSLEEEKAADILVKYFNAEKVNAKKYDYDIDLYENWEYWCGIADKVLSIQRFNLKGLDEEIKQMVEDQINNKLNRIGE